MPYFLNLLGAEPYSDAATPEYMGRLDAPTPEYGTIFNRHNGSQRSVTEMSIQGGGRGNTRRPGTPLFSGTLTARREASPDPGLYGTARRLSLDLSINPTRFVAHQALPGRDPFVPPSRWAAPTFVTRAIPLRTRLEASLDAKDNVLLGQRTQSFGRPDVWPAHLRRYWGGVLECLNNEFLRAADRADLSLGFHPDLNLRTVETYWEFRTPDPTALVCEMEPTLTALGIEASVRSFSYPDGLSQVEFTGNSRSVTLLLGAGILMRVYAKTTRRVRFEIKHSLRENATPIGGSHTSTDPQALYGWLDMLTADAARRLNNVLTVLEGQRLRPVSSLRPYNLVHRVIAASPDQVTAENILSLLVNNGHLRILPSDPLRPVVQALVEMEVLERLGNTRNPTRYVVTPLFRMAVAELRGQRRASRSR